MIFIFAETSLALSQEAPYALEPGLWKTRAEISVSRVPLPTMDDTDCLTISSAKDAKRYVSRYLEANGCRVANWTLNPPKLTLSVKCNNSYGRGAGTLRGTISKMSFRVAGEIQMLSPLDIEMDSELLFVGEHSAPQCKTTSTKLHP